MTSGQFEFAMLLIQFVSIPIAGAVAWGIGKSLVPTTGDGLLTGAISIVAMVIAMGLMVYAGHESMVQWTGLDDQRLAELKVREDQAQCETIAIAAPKRATSKIIEGYYQQGQCEVQNRDGLWYPADFAASNEARFTRSTTTKETTK